MQLNYIINKIYLKNLIFIFSVFFSIHVQAIDYYTNSSGNFTTLSVWGTNSDGSGANPTSLSDFQNGNNTFIINDGHTIIINDSINCAGITVGGGTSGTLTFGNDATDRWLIVQGTFTVNSGATVDISANNATHNLEIQGNLTNNGTINFRNNSQQVVNTILNGTLTVSGNTPIFNNLTIQGGTVTAGVSFDINGTLTIENGAVFADGGYTHTVAGNWTENGNGRMTGTGTINMDATLVQSISTAATFNNITFSNGGIVSIGGNITVNGNFYITGNTKVTTSDRHTIYGNFTVDTGSKYEATDGYLYIYGNDAQTITVTDDCEFDRVYFRNADDDDDLKTIVGNLTVDDYCYIESNADVKSTGTITFSNGFDLRGTWDFSGTVYLKGGTFRNDYNNGSNTDNSFSFGTAEIIIEGYPYIQTGDIMIVNNNVTINSGYLVINDNAALQGTGNDDILLVKDNCTLYLRGTNNFPTGFGTYTFEKLSTVRYDANMNQTIKGGITYGRLYLRYQTKTVDGTLDINDYLYLNGACTLDLGTYDHTLAGNLYNESSNNSITCSGGTFTLDNPDNNQTIYPSGSSGASYLFNNLIFTNTAPTAVRNKRINGDITLSGNFSVTNTGGSSSLPLNIYITTKNIYSNTTGKTFSVGDNVRFYFTGADNFNDIASAFSVTLNPLSIIGFYLNGGTQKIPSLTYGNIYLYGNGNKSVQGNLVIKGDIRRIGYTPVLVDNGYNINAEGNWELAIAYTNMTGTTTFDGADQTISASNFGNIIFAGTETKYLDGNIDVAGNITINNGITVNSDNRYIYLGGNWNNSGTGVFTQTNGRTTFDGTTGNQTIYVNSSNEFGDIYINKTGTPRTVIANSDISCGRNFIFTQNRGDFDLNGHTLSIKGDWYIYTGCTFTHNNGKLIFNGSSQDQVLRNYNSATEYYDIEFKNSALKILTNNAFDFNGDVYINGATVNGQGYNHHVQGDWVNTGTFQSTGAVVFDGAAQSIGSSTFHDLEIAGTGTKTLAGNISCSGWLKIGQRDTLDVSSNNYSITVEEHWYNNEGDGSGYFNCRIGTVTFVGGYSNITTGGTGVGKQFYNLNINNSSSYTRLYPTSNNNLKVLNNLTLTSDASSPFYTYYNDVYIGGSLINDGAYYYQNSDATPNKIVFDGTSGTHEINFGDLFVIQDTIVINGGATYQLTGDFNFSQGGNLRITNGKLDLNHHTLEMYTGQVIIQTNGILEVDSSAVLKVERYQTFFNQNGKVYLIGTTGSPATLTARRNNFEYVQTGASSEFHAKYFLISNTQGNGIDIQDGIIDATNNLSYGTFSGGIGTAYLTINGINLGSGITANEVSFNFHTGLSYNVQRTSGTGAVTFSNATGTFAGESHENDGGNLINWTYPGRITWDGGAGTNNWNDAANWSNNTVPTSSDNVYLDNSIVTNAYTVEVNTTDAIANRIDITGTNTITLSLNGAELDVKDNLTINSGNILIQQNTTDTLKIGGNFSNQGTYNSNSVGTIVFNSQGGYHTINTSSNFYNVIINCDTTTTSVVLGGNITIDNNLSILSGTLSASNKTITIAGNWEVNGGVFDAGTGTVIFNKSSGGNQTISGGTFYNLTTLNAAVKEILKNIEVSRELRINSGSYMNGGEKYIYIGGRFNNYQGKDGFTQTGSGTVIFNGTGNSYLQNAAHDSTVFNNLIFQGNGTKYVYDTIVVNGNLINQLGSNTYLFEDSYIVGEGTSNKFTMTGGRLYVRGENNFPQNFETIELTGGYVDYYSDTNQYIYPTTYYNLMLRAIHPNDNENRNTKTAQGDITVTNYCVVYDTVTTFDMNDFDLYLGGYFDFRFAETPQIDWGTGGVIFYGGNIGIDRYIHFFNNFTKKGTGTVTLYDTIQVNGDMKFESDTRFNMQTYKVTCDSTGKTFTMEDNTYLYTSVLSDDNPGLPTGFANYVINPTSYIWYRGNGKQTIYTNSGTIEYGNLYIYTNTTDTLSLDGKLDVNGNFRMYYNNPVLNDNGYDIYMSGTYNDLRKYYPTNTIYLDGTSQTLINGIGNDTLKFNNLVLNGSTGEKVIQETVTRIKGNLTIGANDTLYPLYYFEFSGNTFTNNGYFRHLRNTVTFNGTNQTIDPGANNDFYGVIFTNGGTKTFSNHGIDVNNGTFRIEDSTIVDLGSLIHTVASENIEFEDVNVDTLRAENATVNFDRNGTQYIPRITTNVIEFSTGGWKILTDTIWTNDIAINNGTYFRPGDATTEAFPIYVYGNWTNNGYFRSHEGTVYFESKNTDAKTIKSNGYQFYNVMFNQNETSVRTYTLDDNTVFSENLTIGQGATLKLNGKTLRLGNNDTGTPAGETHVIQNGGTLYVDAGANLLIDCSDDTASVTVNSGGTLAVIGQDDNFATVSRANNWYAYNMTIESGATIKAKYYHFKHLADSGLYVMSGATIDPSNNFSYGIWSDIYSGTAHGPQKYLYIDTDVSSIGNITDITFNHGGTPVKGTHFNIKRGLNAIDTIFITGTVSGLMGSETYEDEGTGNEIADDGKIQWPSVSTVTWTGATSTDWFTASNWNPAQVPTISINAVVPAATNNPIINTSDTAKCKSLNVTNGIVVIDAGILQLNTDLTLGSGAILGVQNSTSTIIVGRNWNSAADANFIHGDDTVKFISTTITAFITPRNVTFKNLVFDGTSTFFIDGTILDVDGEFKIINGTVYPNTNNYHYYLAGDFNNQGGTFSTEIVGTVELNGDNQTITNGTFSKLIIDGTNTKTTSGDLYCQYNNWTETNRALIVNSTLKAGSGSTMYLNGNVYIASGGTFDDGNQIHHFRGHYWNGEGTYTGNGTIIFDGGTQAIKPSTFNNIELKNQTSDSRNTKYLNGNVNITGNFTVTCYAFYLYDYQITNTSGTGTFTMSQVDYPYNRMYIRGANNYPTGFSTYISDKMSYQIFDGSVDQTIKGKDSGSAPVIQYGQLYLNSPTIKTLGGDIDINGRLYFYNGEVTLDVSSNNYKINLAGNWSNAYKGSFICRQGEVVMDGSNDWPGSTQWIYLGTSGTNDFYKLTINSTSDYLRVYNTDITVDNNLNVISGNFYLYNNFTITVKGDLTASGSGKFATAGTYKLAKSSGSANIQMNGSILNNLTIDAGATYTLLDDMSLYGTFDLVAGTLDCSGKTFNMGNYNDVANISGTYKMGAGGYLKMGNNCTMNILSDGVIEVIGDEGNIATVTSQATNRYNFSVESGAVIKAKYYLFEYMSSAGIYLKDGSSIDATYNFSEGTFTNPASGGTCLRIENNQSFFGESSRINNVTFPINQGNGTYNVTKTSNTVGQLEFYNSTGPLSGESYDNDPGNLIFWTGPVTLTWTGNIDDNWFDKRNWDASNGVQKIPTPTDDVIIAEALNAPIITKDSTFAKNLTIENGAFLTLNSSGGDSDTTLVVYGNITNEGTLIMTNTTDSLVVNGNWERKSGAVFDAGNGTVILKVTSGTKSLINGDAKFNNLVINATGTLELNSDTYIGGNLEIKSGTLDVTNNNYDLCIRGNFINSSTFNARNGLVSLKGTVSGNVTFNPGVSSLYDLKIDASSSTNYQLASNITVTNSIDIFGGTIDANGHIINFGDGDADEVLTIEGGTLNLDTGSSLLMGRGASIIVNSGGIFKAIGTDDDNVATITSQSTTNYSFTINSGGEIQAQYFEIDYIDATGVWFKSGSTINTTYNLSNGTFSNGQSGGRYLLFENSFTVGANDTIRDVIFNSGPDINAKRITGTNPVIFKDAFGLRASYYYEEDEEASPAAHTGLVRWYYTDPTLTWTGNDYSNNVRWDNQHNWSDGEGGDGVPNYNTNVFIPDVDHDPILAAGTDDSVKNITIYSGGHLTIGGNMDLIIQNNLSGDGTLTISNGSNTTIEVGDNWDNLGTFEHGGNSTVKFVKASGTIDVNPGSNPFYNLEFNSNGDGTGSATFRTSSTFDIDGDLTIAANTTFEVTSSSHSINIGGDYSNSGTFISDGATVTFDGSGNQSLNSVGVESFADISFTGGGTKLLNCDISVNGDLNIGSGATLNCGTQTITLIGNWVDNGTFTSSTGHVKFMGSTLQNITKSTTESFYNLTINNTTSGNAIKLNTAVNISKTLYLTDGIIESSSSSILNILAGAIINDGTVANSGSVSSYIDGPVTKTGDTDFTFPVGKGSIFARLGISGITGSSSKFKLEYFDIAPSNTSNMTPLLNEISTVEYWSLSRESGSAEPIITLYWENETRSGTQKEEDVVVAQYSGAAWVSFGGKPATDNGDGTGYCTATTKVTTFDDITIGFEYPTATWDGSESSDWNAPNNWDLGYVPNNKVNVVIPDVTSLPNSPDLGSGSNATMYNIKIENNGNLTLSNGKDLVVYGDFTINSGGIFEVTSGSASSIYIYNKWTNSGTFTPGGSSTVYYSRTDDQDISITEFDNLVVAGSGNKTLSSDIVINKNLNIQSTLVSGANKITIGGDWSNTGTYTGTNGTVEFNGTTQQTVTKGGDGETFYNLRINNSYETMPQIVLNGKITVASTLWMNDGIVQTTSANLITMASGASVTQYVDTSYFVGPVRLFGSNNFDFPIGKDTVYARLGLYDITGNGIFTAEYFNSAPTEDISNNDGNFETISSIEYWTIDRVDANYSAKVKLFYEDSARSEIYNPADLLVAHYNGSRWVSEGSTANSGSPALSGWVTSGQVSSFSPFTFGSSSYNSNPLPVKLTDFSVNVVDNHIVVSWKTETESNSNYFTVQRSNNGTDIENIGDIFAAGYSLKPLKYSLIDNNPYVGTSYYRLIQTDNNGDKSAYDWKSVNYLPDANMTESFTINVYPIPAPQNKINIELIVKNKGTYIIEVFNTTGKRIYTDKLNFDTGNKVYKMNLDKLPKLPEGIYLLNISNNDNKKQIKFIVK